jgi:hypothetical protein
MVRSFINRELDSISLEVWQGHLLSLGVQKQKFESMLVDETWGQFWFYPAMILNPKIRRVIRDLKFEIEWALLNIRCLRERAKR